MGDLKNGYCACCGNKVQYFKHAGNVKCSKCGATTIPKTEKPKPTKASDIIKTQCCANLLEVPKCELVAKVEKLEAINELKLYEVKFDGLYPVPCGLLLYAYDHDSAIELAKETLFDSAKITEIVEVKQPEKPSVVFYESGDY